MTSPPLLELRHHHHPKPISVYCKNKCGKEIYVTWFESIFSLFFFLSKEKKRWHTFPPKLEYFFIVLFSFKEKRDDTLSLKISDEENA
jgi:hypothetical protein